MLQAFLALHDIWQFLGRIYLLSLPETETNSSHLEMNGC